jgi:adenosylhomocysteine nucleosidase
MNARALAGIVVALEAEATSCERWRQSGEIRVKLTGPGAARAAAGARALVDEGVSCLVSWGTSGALVPHLRAGALLIVTHTTDTHGNEYTCDNHLVESLRTALGALSPSLGRALTVDAPLTGQACKLNFADRYAAASVDMESAAVAEVARSAGLPFVAVRAVVDALAFDIPQAACAGMGEDGRSRPLRVLSALTARPFELPQLLRLAAHFAAACRTLQSAASMLANNASSKPLGSTEGAIR